MSLKRFLRSVAGVVVELSPEDEGESPRQVTLEDVVREAPGPNLDQVAFETLPEATRADGGVDRQRIYAEAGVQPLDAEDARLLTAEEVIEKLRVLPETMPLEQRRQTIGMILEALGQSPRDILADAAIKIEALAAYEDAHERQVARQSQQTEQEIAALMAQIEEKRQALQSARVRHQQVAAECEAEAERLKRLTEMFAPARTAGAPSQQPPAQPGSACGGSM
ncbi:MAG: hypothetical protein HY321_07680 [Armatimonadetes bacterium]|nr:hypothetical protein [Armatimonadota bacterium]